MESLTFGKYSYEVMGEFDRARLDRAVDDTIEMIEGMGSWPWPGSLREEVEGLVTEAYAYGITVARAADDAGQEGGDAEATGSR